MKKFHLLALAAVTAGLLALPAGASAASGTCAFEGVAGHISPGVMLQGGGGTYDFATVDPNRTQCDYKGSGPKASSIVSRGSFTNIVCGTGTATGDPATGATKVTQSGNPDQITQVSYYISFAGAQGRLKIQKVNGQNEDPSGPKDPTDNEEIDGHVTIIPTEGSCSAATGVTAFEVVGAFTATWPG